MSESETEYEKSAAAAARALGVKSSTFHKWHSTPVSWFPLDAIERNENGKAVRYNVSRIRAAVKARDSVSGSTQQFQQAKLSREEVRLQKEKIEVEKLQRIHDEEQGNILKRDEMEQAIAEILILVRDEVIGIPKELAKLVGDRETELELIREGDRIVRDILTRMAKGLDKAAKA